MDLLPCPFCGGKAHSAEYSGGVSVECCGDDCLLVDGKTTDEAHARWNRCAQSTPDTAPSDEVAAVLREAETYLTQTPFVPKSLPRDIATRLIRALRATRPASPERTPRPPEELVEALHDPIHETSGRLLATTPVVRPRTWEEERADVVAKRKTGRCADGAERDGGVLYHAVPADSAWGKAACGTKPGRTSGGWAADTAAVVTCAKCIGAASRGEGTP